MNLFDQLAERNIKEAQLRGDFKNLDNLGKKLQLEDGFLVPEEKRMAYKIMKNSGHLPPELIIKKQIHELETGIEHSTEFEQEEINRKVQYLLIQLDMMHGNNMQLFLQDDYYQKIVQKLLRTS